MYNIHFLNDRHASEHKMRKFFFLWLPFIFVTAVILSACSPRYDWREIRGKQIPFTAILPGKPVSSSRAIDLDGLHVTMQMTTAEVDGAIFAVGAASLPNQDNASKALNAMKTALVNNIHGSITSEKSAAAQVGAGIQERSSSIDIEAAGTPGRNGEPAKKLFARFVAKDNRIYQAVVVGPEKAVSREAVETFFTSFKAG